MDPSELRKELEAIAAKKAALLAEQSKIEELEKAFVLVSEHLAAKSNSVENQQTKPVRDRSLYGLMLQKNQTQVLPGLTAGKSKASMIRESFQNCEGKFTASDIYSDLVAKGVMEISKQDVSFALSRMCKTGKIFLVKQGAGKSPSVYSNSKPPPWVTFGNKNSSGADKE